MHYLCSLLQRKPPTTFQTVGFWGSVCLLCNNILGPGIFQLPGLWQQAGWVPTLTLLLFVALWTAQSSLLVGLAISHGVEGNGDFSKNVELSALGALLLPRWGSALVLLVIVANLFTQNALNILIMTQTCDAALLRMFGRTCALDLTASVMQCVTADPDREVSNTLYGETYVVSAGFVLILAVCVPLSLSSLDDNIWVQVIGFGLTLLQLLVWTFNFWAMGQHTSFLPAFGSVQADFAPLIPQVFFNFNFLTTVTCIFSAKQPGVSAGKVVTTGVGLALLQALVISVFGSMAFDIPGGSETSLTNIIAQAPPEGVWKASSDFSFVFAFANILTAIPVFAIFMRRNIVDYFEFKGVVALRATQVFCVAAPWLVALGFYPFKSFAVIVDWASAFTIVPMNITIPVLLYLLYQRRHAAGHAPLKYTAPGAIEGDAAADPKAAATGGGSTLVDDSVSRVGPAVFIDSPLATAGARAALGVDAPQEWGATRVAPSALAAAGGAVGGEAAGGSQFEGGIDHTLQVLPCACRPLVSSRNYAWGVFALSVLASLAAFALQIDKAVNPEIDGADDDDGGGGEPPGPEPSPAALVRALLSAALK